jgi:hypothetical protein
MMRMKRTLLFLCLVGGGIQAPLIVARSQDAPGATRVDFQAIPMPVCFEALLTLGPVAVDSRKDLHSWVRWHSPPCLGLDMPEIDFSKYTLIGQWVELGTCRGGQGSEISVLRDDAARAYRHQVSAASMPCRGHSRKAHWILVPKLPAGFTVLFESAER